MNEWRSFLARHRELPALLALGGVLLVVAGVWREQILEQRRHARHAVRMPRQPPPPVDPTTREANPAERKAAIASIESQLAAFRHDDYRRAIYYQSAALRGQFASVDAFRRMMLTRYPQFARSKKAEFLEARSDDRGERVEIVVSVTGLDGIKVRCAYDMVLEDGVFRVNNVAGGLTPDFAPEDSA